MADCDLKVSIFQHIRLHGLNSSLADCDPIVNLEIVKAMNGLNSSLADCDYCIEEDSNDYRIMFKFLFGRLRQKLTRETELFHYRLNSSLADCDKVQINSSHSCPSCLNSSLADCDA